MSDTLKLADLTFEIRRSARRKTLGLTVDRGGELVVHAPETASVDELEEWTRKKLRWVHQKLAIKRELTPKGRQPEYVSGENFQYLGRAYRSVLMDHQRTALAFDGHRFVLRKDARPAAAEHFRRWYIEAGSQWVTRRTRLLMRKVGAEPSRIEIRDLGFRWGSCGNSGAVLLNWRLLQLPVRLADYVICHELVHLREPHHGPAFWALLESVQPDWRERKRELAQKAQTLYWV
ncbi:MAG: M48 family metallopeptidase [Terriglobia bacterium]